VYQVEQKQHPRRLSIVRRCVIGCILTGSQATARAQSLLGVVGLPLVLLRIVVVRMAGGQGLGAVLALETVLPLIVMTLLYLAIFKFSRVGDGSLHYLPVVLFVYI